MSEDYMCWKYVYLITHLINTTDSKCKINDESFHGSFCILILQLMDMGFTREHCIEALALTPSLEQATEFILSNRSADLEARPTAPPAPQNVSEVTHWVFK